MRRRFPRLAGALAALVCLAACDPPAKEESSARFAAVKRKAADAGASFCEKQWPAADARQLAALPERALPGAPAAPPARASWKWVNLWATWCLPCVEEMGLLSRWKTSLAKDGIDLDLELWSVDDEQAKLTAYIAEKPMPGRVRWLRSSDDLPAVLESLGADRMAAIPVHALVDAGGNLRCVRVGSVHDEDYGAVKSLLAAR